MTAWIRTYENGANYIESLDGIDWAHAPLPYPWHKCSPQTRGWFGLSYTERCACGAARMDGRGRWMDKNETRKGRKRQRQEDRAPRETVTCQSCGTAYEAVAGSPKAREQLCNRCWADRLIAAHGYRT